MTRALPTSQGGEAHTLGPWGWFGNQHGIYLATPDRGRLFIMGFDRWGMQKAQPTFRGSDGLMHPAAELVTFAVGDKVSTGFKAAKSDETVYRYDISGIDNPDARLIAAAPCLLEALIEMIEHFERVDGDERHKAVIAKACAAYAKASPQGASEAREQGEG